jgi:asparagine synthase (glutamine-hydrolysing)
LGTETDQPGPDTGIVSARLPLAFLAISYESGAEPAPDKPGGEGRVGAAAAMLTDEAPRPIGGGTQVWLTGSQPWIEAGPDDSFTGLLSRSPEPAALTARLSQLLAARPRYPLVLDPAAARVLSGITPPFAVVACVGSDRPLIAATDRMGCRHLYWHQGEGWAGISTSALALACCAASAPHSEALAVRSMLGFHLGSSSPFAGIHKVRAAGICALRHGRVRVTEYADPWPEPGTLMAIPTATAAPASKVAGLLRACGEWAAEEFGDAVIELSGGLDSRILLAAVPPSRRSDLQAVTIDTPGTKDARIARQLAAITGLDHRVLPLARLEELTPAAAWALVRRAAIRDDCSANPVAHGVLDWIEDRIGVQPRMHGAGGEIGRGFYYLGQRQHRQVSAALTARLVRWRMAANEAVDPACFGAELAPWVRSTALSSVQRVLTGYRCDWLTATDEFYARERVVRWAGLRLSASSTERTLLSSLLHPDFVAVARACPPELKRNSRFMATVLADLDPDLARLPLGSGYIPARLARPTVLGRARSCPVTGKRVVHKISQRLAGAGRPGAGQSALTRLVLEHWRAVPDLLAGLPATGMVDAWWLGRLVDGACDADPATVGYLANLVVMAEGTAFDPKLVTSARQTAS